MLPLIMTELHMVSQLVADRAEPYAEPEPVFWDVHRGGELGGHCRGIDARYLECRSIEYGSREDPEGVIHGRIDSGRVGGITSDEHRKPGDAQAAY